MQQLFLYVPPTPKFLVHLDMPAQGTRGSGGDDEPSDAQLKALARFGFRGSPPATKQDASDILGAYIDAARARRRQ
jgi:hypothetical protein